MYDPRHLLPGAYASLATSGAQRVREQPAPDADWWLDAWRRGTEQARRRTREVRLDISYGARESERFDLYLPTDRVGSLPFAAFVHGAGWRPVPRDAAGFAAKAVHRHGAAFIAIGFGTVPEVDLPAQAEQVRRAWRFLVDNAERFGLDPARGHLLGHGTGAHLAALAAFDAGSPAPASTILLSGIYDLEPARLAARNRQLGVGPETAARLSPVRSIHRIGSRVVVAWGEHEPDESRRQAQRFARSCAASGLEVTQGELAGRGPLASSLELADPHSEVLAPLRARR